MTTDAKATEPDVEVMVSEMLERARAEGKAKTLQSVTSFIEGAGKLLTDAAAFGANSGSSSLSNFVKGQQAGINAVKAWVQSELDETMED